MSRFVPALLFLCAATGIHGYSVTTTNANVKVKENTGVDLTCSYSADFGADPRIEWKLNDKEGSVSYVVYNGKVTETYVGRVSLISSSTLRFSEVTRRDNGNYICEVSSSRSPPKEVTVGLTVLVPPSPPKCNIPQTVTTGKVAVLSCSDGDGSPPPTYKWYKDGTLLPNDPSKIAGFQNATYKLDPNSGKLEFSPATKMDSGQYLCEAVNEAGAAQRCKAMKMEVRDLNTGGIVAGVLIFLVLLGLLIFGVWFAYKRGYLPTKSQR
uniref:Junctional adhesion molecule A n=1 Tax=Kryptolebias marmoratus TaxID=37003 RepID=A0A3Q3FCZ8_KRYMA